VAYTYREQQVEDWQRFLMQMPQGDLNQLLEDAPNPTDVILAAHRDADIKLQTEVERRTAVAASITDPTARAWYQRHTERSLDALAKQLAASTGLQAANALLAWNVGKIRGK
jgi:hypothetical protein